MLKLKEEIPRIKIKVEATYYVSNIPTSPCGCRVTLYLPCDPDRGLSQLLRSPEVKLFDEPLGAEWGAWDEKTGTRLKNTHIVSDTWKDLEAKVNILVQETVNTLRKVCERNKKFLDQKPLDKIYTFEL